MANYNAQNPGKVPEDEDEVMARRLAAAIDKDGHIKGMNKFMSENGMWLAIRFHEDEEAFDKWWVAVRAKYEAGDFTIPSPAPTDLEPPHEGANIPSDETTLDIPLAETEQAPSARALSEVWGEPTSFDTEKRRVAAPTVDPEKVVTPVSPEPPILPTEAELKTALKERFSSERFERAMATLERYGTEEGLRRLKEDDPEIAKQIEVSQNGGERHRHRRGEEKEAQ